MNSTPALAPPALRISFESLRGLDAGYCQRRDRGVRVPSPARAVCRERLMTGQILRSMGWCGATARHHALRSTPTLWTTSSQTLRRSKFPMRNFFFLLRAPIPDVFGLLCRKD
jgi:hypothetical protein